MDTEVLREFVKLAQRLNYGAAARELGMSQSSLSRHISALERELGATLLARSQGVRLTPEGEILLEESSSILASEQRARRRIEEMHRSVQGRVRLIDYHFSRAVKNFLITAARRFRETYPGVTFSFCHIGSGRPMTELLDTGELDVGVLVHCGPAAPVFAEEGVRPHVPLWHEQSRMGIYLRNDELGSGDVDGEGRISIDVLRRLPVLLPMRPEYGNFHDDMVALCAEHGFDASFRFMERGLLEDLAMADMHGCAQIVLESDLRDASAPFSLDPECSFHTIRQPCFATPYLLMPAGGEADAVIGPFARQLEGLEEELRGEE